MLDVTSDSEILSLGLEQRVFDLGGGFFFVGLSFGFFDLNKLEKFDVFP